MKRRLVFIDALSQLLISRRHCTTVATAAILISSKANLLCSAGVLHGDGALEDNTFGQFHRSWPQVPEKSDSLNGYEQPALLQ